jgi:hypothetical protein
MAKRNATALSVRDALRHPFAKVRKRFRADRELDDVERHGAL